MKQIAIVKSRKTAPAIFSQLNFLKHKKNENFFWPQKKFKKKLEK